MLLLMVPAIAAQVVGLLLPAPNTLNLAAALTDANSRYPGLQANNVTLVLQQIATAQTQVRIFDGNGSVDAATLPGYPVVAYRSNDVSLTDKSTYSQLFRMQPNAAADAITTASLVFRANQTKVMVLFELSFYASTARPVLEKSLIDAGVEIAADIELRSVWDVAALTQALTTAQAAIKDDRGSPNDVGTFVYVGADTALFQRTIVAATNLNLTGSPFLWIVTRAAFGLLGNNTVPAAYNGLLALAPFASDAAYAHDAVLAIAAALNQVVVVNRAALTNVTISAALRTVSISNGLTGAISFNEDQDRPAQFEVFNAQSNRLVRVGTYTTGTLTIVNSSAIVYSTGERVAPSFPFRNCTKLASCADCLAQSKCAWCPSTKVCALSAVAAASPCAATVFNDLFQCPRECVESNLPYACLYSANMTIFSTHKPRCDAENSFARIVASTRAGQSACQSAFAAERGCQQLLQRFACSASCQQCATNSSASALPICRSTCDSLIFLSCRMTTQACAGVTDRFAAYCGADSAPCTTTLIDAYPLTTPGGSSGATNPPTPFLTSAAPNAPTTGVPGATTTTAAAVATTNPANALTTAPIAAPTTAPITAPTAAQTTAPVATTTTSAAASTTPLTTIALTIAATTAIAVSTASGTTAGATTTLAGATTALGTSAAGTTAAATTTVATVDATATTNNASAVAVAAEKARYDAVGLAVGLTILVCAVLIVFTILIVLFARAHHCMDDDDDEEKSKTTVLVAATPAVVAAPAKVNHVEDKSEQFDTTTPEPTTEEEPTAEESSEEVKPKQRRKKTSKRK